MSDGVKWLILVGVLTAIIAMFMALPYLTTLTNAIGSLAVAATDLVQFLSLELPKARSLILMLIPNEAQPIINTLITINIVGWYIWLPIKLTVKITSFIFK